MKTARSSSVATSVLPFNNDASIYNHNAQHHSLGLDYNTGSLIPVSLSLVQFSDKRVMRWVAKLHKKNEKLIMKLYPDSPTP